MIANRSSPTRTLGGHPVVAREVWTAMRTELLHAEKDLTRRRDALCARRRELPWVRVEKDYRFEGACGILSLAELFGDADQLIVQHFMFGPDWDEGCTGCSFTADHVDGANLHLRHHGIRFVAVSRAPWQKIERFRTRMQWKFDWVSSYGSDFNFDFHVSFTPEQRQSGQAFANYAFSDPGTDELSGHSVFFRDEDGAIYHTYSTFARGDESVMGAYAYLDLTPRGRNETGPHYDLRDWVRHHDCYGETLHSACACSHESHQPTP